MSSQPPKILTSSRAWLCALVNQLAFPGAGSVMAGRRIGYVQAAIMLVGFVLVMIYLLSYIGAAFHLVADSNLSEEQFKAEYQRWNWAGQSGLILSITAWVWALVSSAMILRQARRGPPEGPELRG
jgi:Na+/proline symporter